MTAARTTNWNALANIVRNPLYWIPEYIDRFRILKLRDESWRREKMTALTLAFTAGYIAGFVAGGQTMKPRASQAIQPFAKGCVSNGIITNARREIDRLWVVGISDDLPMWGRAPIEEIEQSPSPTARPA